MSTRIITIESWRSPAHAAQLMVKHDVGRLLVIDEGKLVVIISRSDVMNHLYGFCSVESSLTKGCQKSASAGRIGGFINGVEIRIRQRLFWYLQISVPVDFL